MFEKYVYLTLIKGGQEKENHSQQIPTFRGYVAIIYLTSS